MCSTERASLDNGTEGFERSASQAARRVSFRVMRGGILYVLGLNNSRVEWQKLSEEAKDRLTEHSKLSRPSLRTQHS